MTRKISLLIALCSVLMVAAPATAAKDGGPAVAVATEGAPDGIGTSPTPAPTEGVADGEEATKPIDPVDAAGTLFEAMQKGNWLAAMAAMLILFVWAARKWAGKVVPWLQTDRGGVALVLVSSFVATLAAGMAAGKTPGLDELRVAFTLAVAAIGGYQGIRRLIWPKEPTKAD